MIKASFEKRLQSLAAAMAAAMVLQCAANGAPATNIDRRGAVSLETPGGKAPAAVLRVGRREAMREYRAVIRENRDDPDSHPSRPELKVTQAVVDYRNAGRRAWLLLYWVGEAGPRAHTPFSQLSIVSAEGEVILSLPARRPAAKVGAAEIANEAQDALMVEVAPGRFALALSYGGQSRMTAHVRLVSLPAKGVPREMWTYPAEDDDRRTESTIFFVHLPHEASKAIALRENEQHWEGDEISLVHRNLLYRLDASRRRYLPAEVAPARLAQILAAAKADKKTFRIEQYGPVGVEDLMDEEEQAAKLERELSAAYRRLREKLSTADRAALLQDEQAWLATRDAETHHEKRSKLVQARVQELKARATGR